MWTSFESVITLFPWLKKVMWTDTFCSNGWLCLVDTVTTHGLLGDVVSSKWGS